MRRFVLQHRLWPIMLLVLSVAMFGCEGDDGDQGPPGPPGTQGTIIGQWEDSAHADASSEAFNHWNEDGEVEAPCARCHSKQGYRDYAEDEQLSGPAPLGSVVSCGACHSTTLYDDAEEVEGETLVSSFGTGAGLKDGVTFPSGAEVTLDGPSNMCMACHQGRASTDDVNEAIANEDFGFINIHYYAAAATLFGGEVRGGYQYEGKSYVGRFTHVPQFDVCTECHMGPDQINHTMEPETEYCVDCHEVVDNPSDPEEPFRDIRRSAPADYDGDGDNTEGMYYEINDTLVPALLTAIQDYAEAEIGTGIVYAGDSYPYFFVDTDGDRVADEDEASFGNRYTEFDATLLKAAYNYQVTQKEPCGYIHNALYVLQIVYDSIEDLGADVSGFVRPVESGQTGILGEWGASGHGDINAEAWNHWSIEEDNFEVPTRCGKCHSAEGYRDYVADGTVDAAVPVTAEPSVGNTLTCEGCHQAEGEFAASLFNDTLWEDPDNVALEPVSFPATDFNSAISATFESNSNMCMACHQGRESGLSVQDAIDTVDTHEFINRHYFAAAAILFGTEVKAAYEYDGRTYKGQNTFPGHGESLSECVDCHMRGENLQHTFEPLTADCDGCHTDVGGTSLTSFENLGLPFGADNTDYDGDGLGESFQGEIDGMLDILYNSIQAYADTTLGAPIVYDGTSYPYWFNDNGAGGGIAGNGIVDGTENSFGNAYTTFDDDLLTAAFNFHAGQDPCGDIHNYEYVLQTLYDSTDFLNNGALDGDVAGSAADAIRPGGITPPDGGGAPDGATLYTGAGCDSCHAADGSGGVGPNIQNIDLATLQSAPSGVGSHDTIPTWTTEEQQAVVDFLATP